MARLDPQERARREEAVRTVRGFVPWYGGLTVLLFLSPITRVLGLPGLPAEVRTVWAFGCLAGLLASAAWLVNRLGDLGQYRIGKGLRFDFWAALLDGQYRSVDPTEQVAAPPASPLEVLRADVNELHPTLCAAGAVPLAETLVSAMAEAESVARLLERHPTDAPGLPLGEARAAVGGFSDHVQALRSAARRGETPGAEATVRFEEDLRALRAAGDALRRGPAPAETGTG